MRSRFSQIQFYVSLNKEQLELVEINRRKNFEIRKRARSEDEVLSDVAKRLEGYANDLGITLDQMRTIMRHENRDEILAKLREDKAANLNIEVSESNGKTKSYKRKFSIYELTHSG